jgi:hypothetical protein
MPLMPHSIDPAQATESEADRGRLAQVPRQVSYKGWWDVAWRVKDQIAADNVSIVAKGLALFGLLAVFPSLAAAMAIYGLIGSPEAIAAQAQTYGELLPEGTLHPPSASSGLILQSITWISIHPEEDRGSLEHTHAQCHHQFVRARVVSSRDKVGGMSRRQAPHQQRQDKNRNDERQATHHAWDSPRFHVRAQSSDCEHNKRDVRTRHE